MPTITKTVAVMDRLPSQDQDDELRVTFVLADEDTGMVLRTVLVSYPTWLDLGSPDQLTVSLVPGDQLNT